MFREGFLFLACTVPDSWRGAAPAYHGQIFYHGHAAGRGTAAAAVCLAAAADVRPFSDFADGRS